MSFSERAPKEEPEPQELRESSYQQYLRNLYAHQQRVRHLGPEPPPAPGRVSSIYDDLPAINFSDFDRSFASLEIFKWNCRDGSVDHLQSIIAGTASASPYFLHGGLLSALRAGNLHIARFLLSIGAPIVYNTPRSILDAPFEQQIPLFDLLVQYGWSPNSPVGGSILLPLILENKTLLRWFLEHRTDPNSVNTLVGASRGILEQAASTCDVKTVRMLLDAGAKVQGSAALHTAAGRCPPGVKSFDDNISPTKEFDEGRIPIMEVLVESGADVNQAEITRYVTPVFPLVYAAMAGAVERVKWLLEHGADPELEGPYGSAVAVAKWGSEEMKRAFSGVQ